MARVSHAAPRWPGRTASALGATSSILAHAVLAYALSQYQSAPRLPEPIITSLVELPPRAEPEPPPPPPPAEDTPPQTTPVTETPRKVVQTRAPSPASNPAPTNLPVVDNPAPVRLEGAVFSNGPSIGLTFGRGPSQPVRAPAPRPLPKATTTNDAPRVVALANLSRKPKPPDLSSALLAQYPPQMKRNGIEGEALVRVTLSAAGRPSDIQLLSESREGFGAACTRSLRGSVWSAPLDERGRQVSTQLHYRCRFRVGL